MDLTAYRICAVIPAYNEEANILSVIRDIRAQYSAVKIVVVNDASTDNTKAIVRAAGETVLSLPINLGIGGAVQTGLKYALEFGYDYVVQVDGDGQHPAAEIGKILEPVIGGEADVVIGSRFLGAGRYKCGLPRRIGMRIFQATNTALTGSRITDNTSGFRAYNRDALSFLARYYPQDYPEPETVIELFRNGFRIREVPVSMRRRSGGISSIRPTQSLYYVVKCLIANVIAFSRKSVARENR